MKRNIPACAGKTIFSFSAKRSQQEHPRVRGENIRHPRGEILLIGTSPRARGKPCSASLWACSMRNIPACAGKTSSAN